MDEQPGTLAHHLPSRPRRSTSPRRVVGFPGSTHLVATLAFPVWSIWTVACHYGIDTRHDWWTDVAPS